jgi:hypothetical protein
MEANLTQIGKAGQTVGPAVCRSVPQLRRRTLLGGVLTILAAAPFLVPGGIKRIADGVNSLWSDRRGAQAVGRRYLAQAPHERDAGFLVQALFGDAGPATSARDMRRQIARRAREDFGRDDAVVIDGWILARSEARFCALSLLT